jgi:hypothetical protein
MILHTTSAFAARRATRLQESSSRLAWRCKAPTPAAMHFIHCEMPRSEATP